MNFIMDLIRRALILLLLALGACAQLPSAGEPLPPIVFVHGNGDTAALWTTTIWRFESNGYDRNLLHAIDFRYPLARNEEAKAQPLRSSAAEAMRELAAKVESIGTTETAGGNMMVERIQVAVLFLPGNLIRASA